MEFVDILASKIRDQMRDPESLLLPQEEWPASPPKARTMLKDPQEWSAFANEPWPRDLTVWMPESNIFQHNGEPVVSGFFGLGKGKDVPGHPGVEQLRLVRKLVQSNLYFMRLEGA